MTGSLGPLFFVISSANFNPFNAFHQSEAHTVDYDSAVFFPSCSSIHTDVLASTRSQFGLTRILAFSASYHIHSIAFLFSFFARFHSWELPLYYVLDNIRRLGVRLCLNDIIWNCNFQGKMSVLHRCMKAMREEHHQTVYTER